MGLNLYLRGTTGATAGFGFQGIAGQQGLQGFIGIGLQGIAGGFGPNGSQGLMGVQGEQGIQGVGGMNGQIGPQGAAGDGGSVGLQGTQGTIGSGTQGTQGPGLGVGGISAYNSVSVSFSSGVGTFTHGISPYLPTTILVCNGNTTQGNESMGVQSFNTSTCTVRLSATSTGTRTVNFLTIL